MGWGIIRRLRTLESLKVLGGENNIVLIDPRDALMITN